MIARQLSCHRSGGISSVIPVLAENAHPFEDPPLRMNNPFELFGLTR
jgi:hypothetical protein